jgi:hypothetical protein
MGKKIKLNPKSIRPSQNFLKERTVNFILTCFFEEQKELLPPPPIVRYDPETEKYIAIDGHNLLAIYDLFKETIEVYQAESAEDHLTQESLPNSSPESLQERNQELKEKYSSIIQVANHLDSTGISSFGDLRKKYPFLENFETAQSYYQENCERFRKMFFPDDLRELKTR